MANSECVEKFSVTFFAQFLSKAKAILEGEKLLCENFYHDESNSIKGFSFLSSIFYMSDEKAVEERERGRKKGNE